MEKKEIKYYEDILRYGWIDLDGHITENLVKMMELRRA